jgi:GNAT superfamily N-acetyltransferase
MSPTVISTPMHPLYDALVDAAHGRFPPVDGRVEVFTPMVGDHHAVVEFTGHSVVLTDRASSDVMAHGADGFGGASHPDMVRWLAGPAGWIGSHDVVLVARGSGGGSLPESTDLDDHPRVVRSRAHRRAVSVHADAMGVLTIGRGLVDRQELSVELLPGAEGQGHGRRLITQGLGMVEAGDLVWAQVAAGNAASLRAFLSCGFVPIGAETLIEPETIVTRYDES